MLFSSTCLLPSSKLELVVVVMGLIVEDTPPEGQLTVPETQVVGQLEVSRMVQPSSRVQRPSKES